MTHTAPKVDLKRFRDGSLEHSMWIYPWDLLDGGVEDPLDELVQSGFARISVAATYHAGRLLLPHNPKRTVHFIEDGVTYFEPRLHYYDGTSLKPRKARIAADEDPLQRITLAAGAKGLKVHAWTVFLHNSRLGRENPGMTVENAYGEHYSYALCPSHPDVRAYAVALATDLADNYNLSALELEAVGYMGYTHLSHHDKAGLCLDLLRDFMLSVCFCPYCKDRIKTSGGDAERIRSIFREELERYFAGQGCTPINDPVSIEQKLVETLGPCDMQALLDARDLVVASLVKQIRQSVRREVGLVMRAASSRFVTGGDAGVDWRHLDGVVDRFLFLQFYRDMDLVKKELETVMGYRAKSMVPVYIGVRPYYPDITSEAELNERLAVLDPCRIDGVQFYNYGLLPRANLEWIRKAIRLHA